MFDPAALIAQARTCSGLSKSGFAQAAGTSRGALDQIEKGQRVPRTDTLQRVFAAAGLEATVTLRRAGPPPDDRAGSLAAWCGQLDPQDPLWSWRWLVGDFVANAFVPARRAARAQSLRVRPGPLSDARWNLLVTALAEHLAFHADLPAPAWTGTAATLERLWWPVHTLPSQRPRALAWSPASFKRRGILIDGRELPAVIP